MRTETVLLNTIDKAREFINMAMTVDEPISLQQGQAYLDGKSLLALFSLNLLKPITIEMAEYMPINFLDFINSVKC